MLTVRLAAKQGPFHRRLRPLQCALAIIGPFPPFLEVFREVPVLCRLVSFCAVSAAWAQSAPVTTASGLIYQSLKEGTGASPAATDVVKVHYRGTFPDSGKEFDSSYSATSPPSSRSTA